MKFSISNTGSDNSFGEGLLRWDYVSDAPDARPDWALAWHSPASTGVGVVMLHGHGSHGDQMLQRPDRRFRLDYCRSRNCDFLTPNLRDNAWMCPEAVQDLHSLIEYAKGQFHWNKVIMAGSSMGATGNLIYAAQHPEQINAVISLGAASDLARYAEWCRERPNNWLITEIGNAIRDSYHDDIAAMDRHSACKNWQRLTMPVWLSHGGDDEIIPISESRRLVALLADKADFHYREIYGGDHDSPCSLFSENMDQALARLC